MAIQIIKKRNIRAMNRYGIIKKKKKTEYKITIPAIVLADSCELLSGIARCVN